MTNPQSQTEIQNSIEQYLTTNPDSESVRQLIELLKNYQSERQSAFVKADLEWKEQLPPSFNNRVERERFRKIYNQLKRQGVRQGVTATYSPELSDEKQTSWKLEEKGIAKTGLLIFSLPGVWEMYDCKLTDKTGKILEEFWHNRHRFYSHHHYHLQRLTRCVCDCLRLILSFVSPVVERLYKFYLLYMFKSTKKPI